MSVLQRATTAAPSLPSRVVLYAGEGFGKTSFAAHAPKPLFLMTQGETGLLALHESDRGAIDPETGDVWVGNTAERVKYKVEPAHLDELIACGWVDDTRGHDELFVTTRGRYWLAKFVKLNGGKL